MKLTTYIAILFALIITGLTACDDEFSPNIPQGRIEQISFAKDTFVFSEAAGKVEVPIQATKYLNHAANIKLQITNETAIEKEHFFIDEQEVKMLLGEAEVGVEVRIIDDTIINPNRTFRMTIESITGGGVPASTGQSCVVVIRNDDYIPEAAVVFDNETATVREDGLTLAVPFHLTKEVPGDVTVTFAQGTDDRQTAIEGTHFVFSNNVKQVTLPEGTLKGEVTLDIINNETADGNVYFDLAIRQVEGALVGLDSICKVTIEDDDLDRSVRFGRPEGDGLWHEEAGEIEVPLIFENGASTERMISGRVVVDSIYGCTNDDFTIIEPEFTTAGNETLKLKIKLKDNEDFGEWGFRLAFRDLKNVRAAEKDYVVDIKDDERILGFSELAYKVNEGEALTVTVALKGGNALERIPVQVEVIPDGTTAEPDQYRLPQSLNPIYVNNAATTFSLTTYQHASKEDRVVKLRVSTTAGANTPGKILTDESTECIVTIKNTDRSIGFGSNEMTASWLGKIQVPVVLADVDEDVVLYVKAKAETIDGATLTIDGNDPSQEALITIPANTTTKYIEVDLQNLKNADQKITLEITNVRGGSVSMTDINENTKTITIGVDMLKTLKEKLEGAYTFTSFRQDQAMVTYENWNVSITSEADGKLVATLDKYIYSNSSNEMGYLPLDYDFTDNTFRMRLGVESGDMTSWNNNTNFRITWFSKNTGNSGTYGTTVPVIIKFDFDKKTLMWNTDGVIASDGKMYPLDWTTATEGLRVGIAYYNKDTDPLAATGNSNTNLRCFKLTKN